MVHTKFDQNRPLVWSVQRAFGQTVVIPKLIFWTRRPQNGYILEKFVIYFLTPHINF